MPLNDIPPGTQVHNVELEEGAWWKLARSAGSSVTLSGFDDEYAIIKLSSGETRKVRKYVKPQLDQYQIKIKKILKLEKLVEIDGKVKDHKPEV